MKQDLSIHYHEISDHLAHNTCCLTNQRVWSLFILGCGYATKFINQNRFKQFINPIQTHELSSIIYLTLVYCLKKYKWEQDLSGTHFKDFFYMIIRYQCLAELKLINNWKDVKTSQSLSLETTNYITHASDLTINVNCDAAYKINIIREFLKTKKPIYLKIFNARLMGYSFQEIGQIYHLSEQSAKSKFAYLKKLVVHKYQKVDNLV